jgi:hypothetical protein
MTRPDGTTARGTGSGAGGLARARAPLLPHGTSFAYYPQQLVHDWTGHNNNGGIVMLELATIVPMAAAGWAFLVWLFGGGFGLALLVFVVLKMLGK